MLAETMNLSAGSAADTPSTPAANEKSRSCLGEPIVGPGRRASDPVRRDQPSMPTASADPGAQPTNAVRALRERLRQG